MRKTLNVIGLVLILVALFIVPLSAYPASSVIGDDPNRVYSVSSTSSASGTRIMDIFTKQQVFAQGGVDIFFGDIIVTPFDSSGWRQVMFALEPMETAGGQYNVNFSRSGSAVDSSLFRLGSYLYGQDDYPISRRSPEGETPTGEYFTGSRIMVGFRLSPVGNDVSTGRLNLTIQVYFCDVTGTGQGRQYTPVLKYSYSWLLPENYTQFTVRVTCQSASTLFSYIGDSYAMPHMPSDMIDYQTIVNKGGYQQGWDEGYTEGQRQGYEVGYSTGMADAEEGGAVVASTFWQIISMPFDLLFSLLNFQLFGLNVWPIVTAVLSIGLFLFLLKKVGVL